MNKSRIIPRPVMVAFILSGAASLIYEISWIKAVGFVLLSTTQVLAITFAAVMFGMAIGGYVGKYLSARFDKPLRTYGVMELVIGIYGVFFTLLINYLPILNESLLEVHSPLSYYAQLFAGVGILLLLPSIIMGSTLPLLAVAVKGRIGEKIGQLYSYNTGGAVVGALAAALIFLPVFGLHKTILIAAVMNLTAGLIALSLSVRYIFVLIALIISLLPFLIVNSCSGLDTGSIYTEGICGIGKKDFLAGRKIIDAKSGRYGEVVVLEEGEFGEIRRLLVNGQGSSSLRLSDMRVSTLLGYTPLLANPEAETSLIIGFGVGAASHILSQHTNTTTVEIEPKVLDVAHHFDAVNKGVLSSPSHQITIDDGRRYLARSPAGSYDIIANHPLDPFQTASSVLFTEEFLRLASSRLSENGVYAQWLPLYDLTDTDFTAMMNTIREVFPNFVVFVNQRQGETLDVPIMIGDSAGEVRQIFVPESGGEIIIVASNQPLLDDESIDRNFANLSQADKNYLSLTGIQESLAIKQLIILNDQVYTSNDIPDLILTDDKPILEFTTPITRIRR